MLEHSSERQRRIQRRAPGLTLVLGALALGTHLSISAYQPAQVFTVPQGQVENVRFDQMTGGVVAGFKGSSQHVLTGVRVAVR